MADGAKPSTAAGGAKYHALKATAAWKVFRETQVHAATHSAGERARRDREREHTEAHVKYPNT